MLLNSLLFISAVLQEKEIHSRSFAHMCFQKCHSLIFTQEQNVLVQHTGIKNTVSKMPPIIKRNAMCGLTSPMSSQTNGYKKYNNTVSLVFFLAS